MSNFKLNKDDNKPFNELDVIPDVPDNEVQDNQQSFVNQEEEPAGRKMFANKKANIALIIGGGLAALITIAAALFAYTDLFMPK